MSHRIRSRQSLRSSCVTRYGRASYAAAIVAIVAGTVSGCREVASATAPVQAVRNLASSTTCVAMPSHALHWYPGEGDTRDMIGSADGVAHGGIAYETGLVGQAPHYNGTNGYMELGAVLPTNAGTVEFWIRRATRPAVSGYDVFFGGVDRPFSDGRATVLALYSGGPSTPDALQWEFGQATGLVTAAQLPPGTWHHLAITWFVAPDNSAGATVYADGAFAGSVTTSLTDGHNGFAAPWVGAYDDAASGIIARNFANATIDEVTIYDRQLGPDEIQDIATAGAAGKCPGTPPPTFSFTGFFAPVSNPPAVNVVNSGRAVPMKFSLGGNQGLDVLVAGSPSVETVSCTSDELILPATAAASTGGSALSYDDASDTYMYTWKTAREWAGSCRDIVFAFVDGSVHRAQFRFTR